MHAIDVACCVQDAQEEVVATNAEMTAPFASLAIGEGSKIRKTLRRADTKLGFFRPKTTASFKNWRLLLRAQV